MIRIFSLSIFLLLTVISALSAQEVTVICTGDIIAGSEVLPSPPFKKTEAFSLRKNTFKKVQHILQRGDITIGNLEGSLGYGGIQIVDKGYRGYSFRFPSETGDILRRAGFTALNLANNHSFDCTGEGLYETYLALYQAGIMSVGLYELPWHIPELPEEARWTMPLVKVKGLTIALLGFASREVFKSINYIEECQEVISQAEEKADITIVTFHGGAELKEQATKGMEYYLEERRGNTVAFARGAVDAGADLVFGHGPHVLRGMEFYQDRLIAYSLGNFCDLGLMKYIYPGEKNIQSSVILEVVLDPSGNFLRGKVWPITTADRGIPVHDKSQKVLKRINELNRQIGTGLR